MVQPIGKQHFGFFVDGRPTTLKALHDALMAIPPYRITDADIDGVPDVRELFVAHGGFEDTAPTNRKWDGVNEIIGFGGRAGRTSSPPLPQAYLRIRLVDTAVQSLPALLNHMAALRPCNRKYPSAPMVQHRI